VRSWFHRLGSGADCLGQFGCMRVGVKLRNNIQTEIDGWPAMCCRNLFLAATGNMIMARDFTQPHTEWEMRWHRYLPAFWVGRPWNRGSSICGGERLISSLNRPVCSGIKFSTGEIRTFTSNPTGSEGSFSGANTAGAWSWPLTPNWFRRQCVTRYLLIQQQYTALDWRRQLRRLFIA
jgi:hypothetical protein